MLFRLGLRVRESRSAVLGSGFFEMRPMGLQGIMGHPHMYKYYKNIPNLPGQHPSKLAVG